MIRMFVMLASVGRTIGNRAVAIAPAMMLAAACQEPPFAHTNVSDELAEYTVTLEGVPDTLRGYGALFTARLVASPEVPPEFQRVFLSTNDRDLPPYGADGSYRGQRRSAIPVAVTVIARLGAYVHQRQVVVYSDIDSIGLTCPSTGCGPLAALGHTLDIGTQAFVQGPVPMDGLMYVLSNDRGEVLVRDTLVLEGVGLFGESAYRVRARGNGESWVLFQADGALDSVLVSVRQVPESFTLGCPSLMVGQSGQITASDPVDIGGSPVDEVFEINWVRDLETLWTGDATVDADGTVTALAPGIVYASGFLSAFPGRAAGTCAIEIR